MIQKLLKNKIFYFFIFIIYKMSKTRCNKCHLGGFYKGSISKTHRGDLDFTGKKGLKSRTRRGDLDFTGKKGLKSKTRRGDLDFTGKKGLKSKTRRGDLDFTTKYGNKVFHRNNKYVKIPNDKPYELF